MKATYRSLFVIGILAGLCAMFGPYRFAPGADVEPHPEFPECLRVNTKQSLVHLGSLDSFDITEDGTQAAKYMLDYIAKGDAESLSEAVKIYEKIIPRENFGGEYTALKWIAEALLADSEKQQELLADRYNWEFFEFVIAGQYGQLREYLLEKYHLRDESEGEAAPDAKNRQRAMEDFLLFNNPHRENWEKTSKILEVLDVHPGEVVVDIGSGPGYYTFKFADLVGDSGRVYAVETRDVHVGYISRIVQKYGLKNVHAIQTFPEDRGLPVQEKADLIFMCSLYHILYATLGQDELADYLASIRNLLKDGGRFVVVDNGMVEDETLPYHGPYISKDLVIRQLQHFGFKLVGYHRFIPQRYVLEFEKGPIPEPAPVKRDGLYPADCVPVTSANSLITVLIGGRDTGFTDGGRAAAKILYPALESQDPDQLRAAIAAYDELIPKERFGDEYSGLKWFCEFMLASEDERRQMLANPHDRDYFKIAADNDFALLKKYVKSKYLLDAYEEQDYRTPEQKESGRRLQLIPRFSGVTQEDVIIWGELFTYGNPARERWEKTSETLDFLNIRPGDVVGDVGCGVGYYTYRFANRVGPSGRVYAVDTVQAVLDRVIAASAKHDLPVVPVLSKANNTELPPNSCDLIFICTMYHAIYVTSIEFVKDEFIASIKAALKPGGRFVIADNTILPESENPFYGPRIQKELIISQMKNYGFRLVDFAQPIRQRYILVFEKE